MRRANTTICTMLYFHQFLELLFPTETLFMINFIMGVSHEGKITIGSRECVSTGATDARTRRSLGHHLLHPLILRLLVLCAPTVLRSRALQDPLAPAEPNS